MAALGAETPLIIGPSDVIDLVSVTPMIMFPPAEVTVAPNETPADREDLAESDESDVHIEASPAELPEILITADARVAAIGETDAPRTVTLEAAVTGLLVATIELGNLMSEVKSWVMERGF